LPESSHDVQTGPTQSGSRDDTNLGMAAGHRVQAVEGIQKKPATE